MGDFLMGVITTLAILLFVSFEHSQTERGKIISQCIEQADKNYQTIEQRLKALEQPFETVAPKP